MNDRPRNESATRKLCMVFRSLKSNPTTQWWMLLGASACLAVVTLYFIMPAPEFHGYLQDVTVESCKRPIEVAHDAIAYWNRQIARRPAAARQGWQEDSRETLEDGPGLVLTVTITRERRLFETQKPWNKGHVFASAWQEVDVDKTYHARNGGSSCAAYPAGMHTMAFNDQFFYGYPKNQGWPPPKDRQFPKSSKDRTCSREVPEICGRLSWQGGIADTCSLPKTPY